MTPIQLRKLVLHCVTFAVQPIPNLSQNNSKVAPERSQTHPKTMTVCMSACVSWCLYFLELLECWGCGVVGCSSCIVVDSFLRVSFANVWGWGEIDCIYRLQNPFGEQNICLDSLVTAPVTLRMTMIASADPAAF